MPVCISAGSHRALTHSCLTVFLAVKNMYCYCGKGGWFQNFPALKGKVMHVEFHPQKVQSGPLGRACPLGMFKVHFRASPPWKSDSAMPRRAAKLASSENELGIPREVANALGGV